LPDRLPRNIVFTTIVNGGIYFDKGVSRREVRGFARGSGIGRGEMRAAANDAAGARISSSGS
jgi:hypothetical protein